MSNRTKQLFAETIKNMLRQKDLKDIRVQDLCEACDLNRRTFYYHFTDKYDLVAWMIDQEYEKLTGQKTNWMSTDIMTQYYSYIQQNQKHYRRLYSDPGISELANSIIQYNYSRYEQNLKRLLGCNELTDSQKFDLRFHCYGGLYMSREWILNGCKQPPEEITRKIYDNMPDWMRGHFQ